MRFWDSSALVPICLEETKSPALGDLLREDGAIAVWWGTWVECLSAFARARRESALSTAQEEEAKAVLRSLASVWTEVQPVEDVRSLCTRLLLSHPLRAADSLQLAAAIAWTGGRPAGEGFVCLDRRLREAAHREGFRLLPTL
ncbi:MAG: type II toxin-antitoxin system VapC family toxin [Deferrisomatales bacterium]